MTAVLHGPKRPINVTLSEALIRDAEVLTPNQSETVERLLLAYVRGENERRIDIALAAIQAHQDEHGLWGEEFSTLYASIRCSYRPGA
jgi:hypothetical protein